MDSHLSAGSRPRPCPCFPRASAVPASDSVLLDTVPRPLGLTRHLSCPPHPSPWLLKQVLFSLASGNVAGAFEIITTNDSIGEVFVARPLDREELDLYILKVGTGPAPGLVTNDLEGNSTVSTLWSASLLCPAPRGQEWWALGGRTPGSQAEELGAPSAVRAPSKLVEPGESRLLHRHSVAQESRLLWPASVYPHEMGTRASTWLPPPQ